MDNLIIESTESSPEINFDASNGVLKLIGRSYPDNPFLFYKPVLGWVKNFISTTENKKLNLTIEVAYCNSSTLKVFYDLFDLLEGAQKRNVAISIYWQFATHNHTMRDVVADFKSEFRELVIHAIEVESPKI